MKAYSLSFKVVQIVYQKNENCPSYDALNDHRYSNNNRKVEYVLNESFVGSHTSNGGEIPLGHI